MNPKPFLGNDYLLDTDLAKDLYKTYAENLPIIDYHCHLDAKEIAEDKEYENPTQIMLSGDHYKWRLMRAAGIDETYITGPSSDKEKFFAFAEALQMAAGHPVYYWTHMELKTYFDYEGNLNKRTSEEVWKRCCKKLQSGLTARKIIAGSNVKVICTTDDPADDLAAHRQCRKEQNFKVAVLPTYRPDKSVNIHKAGFSQYIQTLGKTQNTEIRDLDTLKVVLEQRLDWFIKHGCKVADHGLDRIFFRECTAEEAGSIFRSALSGAAIDRSQTQQYITHMMLFFGRLYAERGIVMQLHYGALRNVNSKMMERLGPDTGFDCIHDTGCGEALTAFLDQLDKEQQLPKTIVYSLNPTDNALLDTVTGSFYQQGIRSKVHHGAAWWFNDHKKGIQEHLQTYASLTPIGTFLGMLTDSRCFLSFSRHDFFRRILCSWIVGLMENGEYPAEPELAGEIIKNIAYYNAKTYFGF